MGSIVGSTHRRRSRREYDSSAYVVVTAAVTAQIACAAGLPFYPRRILYRSSACEKDE
jgi:hypothetical protein